MGTEVTPAAKVGELRAELSELQCDMARVSGILKGLSESFRRDGSPEMAKFLTETSDNLAERLRKVDGLRWALLNMDVPS